MGYVAFIPRSGKGTVYSTAASRAITGRNSASERHYSFSAIPCSRDIVIISGLYHYQVNNFTPSWLARLECQTWFVYTAARAEPPSSGR